MRLLSFLLLIQSMAICQTNNFTKLKIDWFSHHENISSIYFEILHQNNKLYLIDLNDTTQKIDIDYFKLEYILSFINSVESQSDSCEGGQVSGGDTRLDLDIDGKVVSLIDCYSNEVDAEEFIKFIKRNKTELEKECNQTIKIESKFVLNKHFTEKLKGCWDISPDFLPKINEVLVLSKRKTCNRNQWCFNEVYLSSTSKNNLFELLPSKSDSLEGYQSGNWFVEFYQSENNRIKLKLTHKSFIEGKIEGLFIEEKYKDKFLEFVFSIIEFKEGIIILKLVDMKKNKI